VTRTQCARKQLIPKDRDPDLVPLQERLPAAAGLLDLVEMDWRGRGVGSPLGFGAASCRTIAEEGIRDAGY
jgi:hypothetical protein